MLLKSGDHKIFTKSERNLMLLSAMAGPESAALVLFEIPLLLLLFYSLSLSLSFPLYNLCHNSIFSAAVTFYYLQQSSSSNAGYWAMN